jgi:transposase-like protein
MSYVEQGLLPAINTLLPEVEQRFCVRHLYNNFRKKFPGKKLKELMWRAAKSTYRNAFEREMMAIKAISEEAFNYLCEIDPRHWTKAMFKGDSKCDTLVNNISEAFNSVIVVRRSKPVVSMLEDIRVYVMERWQKNREKIAKYADGEVLPNIKKRLEKESAYANNWIVRYDHSLILFMENYGDFAILCL